MFWRFVSAAPIPVVQVERPSPAGRSLRAPAKTQFSYKSTSKSAVSAGGTGWARRHVANPPRVYLTGDVILHTYLDPRVADRTLVRAANVYEKHTVD